MVRHSPPVLLTSIQLIQTATHAWVHIRLSLSLFSKQSLEVKVAVEADEMHLTLLDHTEESTAMTRVSANRAVMALTAMCVSLPRCAKVHG